MLQPHIVWALCAHYDIRYPAEMITVTKCELHTLFKSGSAKLVKTPFTDAFPKDFHQGLELARMRELHPIPAWRVGITQFQIRQTHASFLIAEASGFRATIAVFPADPLTHVPTLEAAFDMIDAINEGLDDAPELRSHVLREVIESVPDLDDDEWAELEAYARAAGLRPWNE